MLRAFINNAAWTAIAVHIRVYVGGIRSVMTNALSLLLQRARKGRASTYRQGKLTGKGKWRYREWHGHRSYFTARLYCILNALFHTRRAATASSSNRGVLYELLRSLVYIMHVKIVRKRHIRVATGQEKGETAVRYSCAAITRCYALLIIGFIRTEFCEFCSARTFPDSLWHTSWAYRHAHTSQCRILVFPIACARRRFYARIVIANSLSLIVIAGTSKRLDKNDFSRAAIDR